MAGSCTEGLMTVVVRNETVQLVVELDSVQDLLDHDNGVGYLVLFVADLEIVAVTSLVNWRLDGN